MKDKFPVSFEKSQTREQFDTLYMPMAGAYDEPFPFLTGKARELRDAAQLQKAKSACSGVQRNVHGFLDTLPLALLLHTALLKLFSWRHFN